MKASRASQALATNGSHSKTCELSDVQFSSSENVPVMVLKSRVSVLPRNSMKTDVGHTKSLPSSKHMVVSPNRERLSVPSLATTVMNVGALTPVGALEQPVGLA